MDKHNFGMSDLISVLVFVFGLAILVLGAVCLFMQLRDLTMVVVFIALGFAFLSWRITRRDARPWETTKLFRVLISTLLWISLFCVLAHLVFCLLAWIHGDGWTDDVMQKLGIYSFPYLMELSFLGCCMVFNALLELYRSARKTRRDR